MMHRIVEAFTRPRYQLTAMDEFVQGLTVFVVIFLGIGMALVIWYVIDRISWRRKR